MPSLLIRGGAVLDVAAGTEALADLAVRDGRIEAIGALDPVATYDRTIEAAGLYVAPGFIDIHTHVFDHGLFRTTRLRADRVGIEQGVACLVDAGSAGAATIDAFPRFVHETQRTPVFALVNVGSPGLPQLGGGHSSRPELVSLAGTVEAVERHRGWVRGVKVQASASHAGPLGLEAVRIARKAAELTGVPLMVHIGNAPPVLDDVLDLLRPGDIVTHAYHGKVGGSLGRDGQVLPAFREAVARGVVIDIGHGRSSFAFRTAERALAQRLPVHTISTDLHRGNLDRYVVSLARTVTKLLLLGLPLIEAIRAVTLTPARALHLDADGFGTIEANRPAHLTLFRLEQTPLELEDAEGERRTAERWLRPLLTVAGGECFEVTAPL